MNIRVTGRHLEITPAIRQYAEGKVARLPRYYDRVNSIDVVADRHEYDHAIEMIVHTDGAMPFIGKSSGRDLYACIDHVVHKLERQLSDFKSKRRDRKHRA